MKPRQKRLVLLLSGLLVLGVAAGFVLNALDNNLSYFFSPSEVVAGKAPANHVFRLGGLVEKGSVKRSNNDLGVSFIVSDGKEKMTVHYSGILPDLFTEGQGVIAQGKLNSDNVFIADEVLAKHDENYMPPEVAEALQHSQQKGHQEGVKAMAEQGAAQ